MIHRILFLLSCLALVTTACGHSDNPARMATAPSLEPLRSAVAQAPGPGDRYPLALGTRWEYDLVYSQRFRANGDAEFGPWKTTHIRVTAEATRTTVIEGHVYTVIDELIYFTSVGEVPYRDRQFLRQDASALYSFPNLGGIGAPEDAAGETPTPTFHESVLLVYPPRVGARWKSSLRSDYEFEVEAIEPVRTVLGVFSAARVRGALHSGQPGTEPELTWYGKPGVVRHRSKRADDAVLPNGQHGIRETINEQLLTSFVPG